MVFEGNLLRGIGAGFIHDSLERMVIAFVCAVFCAVPVFLVALVYYCVLGRVPPEDMLDEPKKPDGLFLEFNRFTLLALALAGVWIFFVRASVFPSKVEAFQENRAAAERGDDSAQFNLAWHYGKGDAVQQDFVEAAKWYRKAAEQGHADAQNSLGVVYDSGQGVPQNYEEAAKWFARAAEQGEV
jgi:hypothetical protein